MLDERTVNTEQVVPDVMRGEPEFQQRLGMFERRVNFIRALGESGAVQGTLDSRPSDYHAFGWAVSPDGRWAVRSEDNHPEHALVLVDALASTFRDSARNPPTSWGSV